MNDKDFYIILDGIEAMERYLRLPASEIIDLLEDGFEKKNDTLINDLICDIRAHFNCNKNEI